MGAFVLPAGLGLRSAHTVCPTSLSPESLQPQRHPDGVTNFRNASDGAAASLQEPRLYRHPPGISSN